MKNILCGVSPQCCGPWSHNTVGRVHLETEPTLSAKMLFAYLRREPLLRCEGCIRLLAKDAFASLRTVLSHISEGGLCCKY